MVFNRELFCLHSTYLYKLSIIRLDYKVKYMLNIEYVCVCVKMEGCDAISQFKLPIKIEW